MIEFFKQNFALLTLIGATLAVCSGVVWAIVYYLTYAVRSQVLGKTIWSGNARNNSVALTFDDGPAPDTLEILDILREENMKATFFLIGKQVEKYPEIAKRITDENHQIGNHSYSHPIFLFCGADKTSRELEKTQEIIKEATGITPKLARPPCGVRSPAYFAAAEELGLQTVQWSDAGFDWKKISAKRIARNVLETVQNNSIVLLHDGDSSGKSNRQATVKALPLILRGLKEKGLHVAPLDRMCPEIYESKPGSNFIAQSIKGEKQR
ncbi:MAG: polysaccharide deacetylase family protein [Pyrinomonadaceae bacterium]|nr:polysaccharide deacetylase family protein [Pyrinomonadaceae bacterium]